MRDRRNASVTLLVRRVRNVSVTRVLVHCGDTARYGRVTDGARFFKFSIGNPKEIATPARREIYHTREFRPPKEGATKTIGIC